MNKKTTLSHTPAFLAVLIFGSVCGVFATSNTALGGPASTSQDTNDQQGVRAGGAEAPERDLYDRWDRLLDGSFRLDIDDDANKNFKIATDPEVRFLVDEARTLLRDGKHEQAVRILQRLIDDFPNHVYQVSKTQYLGAGEIARYWIRQSGPEGRQAYEKLVERVAGPVLEAAERNQDREALMGLAKRYDLSRHGAEALSIAADMAFERGEFSICELLIRRVLFMLPKDDPVRARLVARLGLARSLAGESVSSLQGELPKEASVIIKGEHQPARELLANSEPRETRGPRSDWPTYGGENRRNRSAQVPAPPAELEEAWTEPILREPTSYSPFVDTFPFQPIRVGDSLILNDSINLWAINLFSAEVLWVHRGPMAGAEDRREWTLDRLLDTNPSPLSMKIVAGLTEARGIVLGNVLKPIVDRNRHQLDGRIINVPIPERLLIAVDASTGEELWRQDRIEGEGSELLRRLSVPSPPVVVGDRVIAFGYYFEGGINAFTVCLDLETGAMVSSTPLCISQIELTMFGMPFHEHTTAAVSASGNTVYVSTNLGLMVAVDSVTGWVRWMTEYESIPIHPARHFLRPLPRKVYWNNNPPIVDGDTVFVTPHDADMMFAFDRVTGRKKWETRVRLGSSRRGRGHPIDTVVGVRDKHVIVTGPSIIAALDTEYGRVRWATPIDLSEYGLVTGRGQLSDREAMIPSSTGLLHVAMETGDVQAVSRWSSSNADAGNVLLFRDAVVTAGHDDLTVYFDLEAAITLAEGRVQQSRETFADLVLLADLNRLKRRHSEAVLYYERALAKAEEANLPAREIRQVRLGLYNSCLEDGRKLRDEGDTLAAIARLESAKKHAQSPEEELSAGFDLLPLLAMLEDSSRYIELIKALDERHGRHVVTQPPVSGPAGLILMLMLANFHEGREEFESEVAVFQRMMGRYGSEWLNKSSVRDACFRRIRGLIERLGPEVYAEFDRQASALAETALQSRDPDSMLHVLETFPNASNIGSYAVSLGELLLDLGRHKDLFSRLSSFLRDYPAAKEAQRILLLLAEAALNIGNRDLATTLSDFVRRRGHPSDGLLEIPPVSRPPTPAGRPLSLQTNLVGIFPELKRTSLINVQGRFDESVGSMAFVQQDNSIVAVDTTSNADGVESLWSAELSEQLWDIWVFASGDGVLCVADRQAQRFDARTGEEVWSVGFKTPVSSAKMSSGLLFLLTERRGSEAPSRLVAIEPTTGATLWGRELEERAPPWFEVAGPLLILPRLRDRAQALDVLSTATGEALEHGIPFSSRGNQVYILPELDLFLVPVPKQSPSSRRRPRFSPHDLQAYDMHDLSELWLEKDLFLEDAVAVSDSLLALRTGSKTDRVEWRVLDSRSGNAVRSPVPLERTWKVLNIESSPEGASNRVFLVAKYPDNWRVKDPIEIAALDLLAEGKEILWKNELDLGKGTIRIPHQVHRFDDRYLVTLDILPQGTNDSVTEFFVIACDNGALDDRQKLKLQHQSKYVDKVRLSRDSRSISALKDRHLFAVDLKEIKR